MFRWVSICDKTSCLRINLNSEPHNLKFCPSRSFFFDEARHKLRSHFYVLWFTRKQHCLVAGRRREKSTGRIDWEEAGWKWTATTIMVSQIRSSERPHGDALIVLCISLTNFASRESVGVRRETRPQMPKVVDELGVDRTLRRQLSTLQRRKRSAFRISL
jgi:hypothetical protein